MGKKGKAIIVGGSIAGVSCAHSLTLAGWDVLVLEKSSEPPARSPTGAGLGLDPQARQIIKSWLPRPHLLDEITLPLSIDQVKNYDFLRDSEFYSTISPIGVCFFYHIVSWGL